MLFSEARARRIDLDQNAGEVALLSSGTLTTSSLSLQRGLTPAELPRRRHSYADRDTDTKWRTASNRLAHCVADPIAADLSQIPALLSAIKNDWLNPGSINRQSAEAGKV